jgi:uncharacterized protein (TIGR00159 family)
MRFLVDIGFMPFRILDILDIALVAIILYVLYKLVKGTIALNISLGIASIFFLYWLVRTLQMRLVAGILGQFIEVGVIALLIVFQQEVRRVLLLIGRNTLRAQPGKNWRSFLPWNWELKEGFGLSTNEIVRACLSMSETKTGALIVISGTTDLRNFSTTGVEMRALLRAELLETIFQKTAPLHDGAVIIASNLIVAASCILPVTQSPQLPRHYGTRHRAAVGLTEQTDALALIVSEETGSISFSRNGNITSDLDADSLRQAIEQFVGRGTKPGSPANGPTEAPSHHGA